MYIYIYINIIYYIDLIFNIKIFIMFCLMSFYHVFLLFGESCFTSETQI